MQPRLLGGRYELVDRVGAGGMGEVWRATDRVLHRTVAVKVMLPGLVADPEFERRFLFEARAMASLRHPGVVAIHDYRSDAEGAFLVMEFIEGEPLAGTLRRVGRLNPADTMHLVAQAADALGAAHAQGIVHRDVKPGNLLIRPGGELVLTDFGIARAASSTGLTAQGDVLGTPSYLAPEQVLGQPATPVSDLYALGVVAYECLTGRRPFEAENPFGTAMKRLQEPPPPLPPDVPVEVARIVGGALVREPEGRWRSAGDLAAAARRATTSGSLVAPATVDARPAAGRRRTWLAVGAVVAAVLLVVAGIGAMKLIGRGGGLPSSVAGRYVPCGAAYCPKAPMCWDGLTAIGGRAQPPTARDCAEVHRWETIAVTLLPPDAVDVRQDELLERRADVAEFCSVTRQQARSLHPDLTEALAPEPWPVRVGDVWLLSCLGGGPEHSGVLFRTGAS